MLLIEASIRVPLALALLRQRMREASLCFTDQIRVGGEVYVLDHIEFEPPGAGSVGLSAVSDAMTVTFDRQTHVVSGSFVRVTQNFRPFVTTLSVLQSAGAAGMDRSAAAGWVFNGTAQLEFDLRVRVRDDAVAELYAQFHDIPLPRNLAALVGPDVAMLLTTETSTVAARLAPLFDSFVIPIDLGDVQHALGGRQLHVINAGLIYAASTVVPEWDRLALRLEFDVHAYGAAPWQVPPPDGSRLYLPPDLPQQSFAAWDDFYAGHVKDGGALVDDLSFFVDAEHLLIPPIVDELLVGLDSDHTRIERALPPGVGGYWTHGTWHVDPDDTSHIEILTYVNVRHACTCFFANSDVELLLTFHLYPVATADGGIGFEVTVYWDAVDAILSCCEVTAALFWPIVGAVFAAEGRINWWQWLGIWGGQIVLSPVALFVGAVIYAGGYSPGSVPLNLSDVTVTQIGDHRFDLAIPRSSTPLASTEARFVAQAAAVDGPVFRARMDAPVEAQPANLQVIHAETTFTWRDTGRCTEAIRLAATATMQLRNAGQTPMTVCAVTVLHDRPGLYRRGVTAPVGTVVSPGGTFHIDVNVTVEALYAAFDNPEFEDWYDLELLIQTSGGARYLRVGAVHPPTADEGNEVAFQRRIRCDGIGHIEPLPRLVIPRVIGDPAIYERGRRAQSVIWEMIFGNAAPQLEFRYATDSGAARSTADANGNAYLSTLVATDGAAPALELRTPADASATGALAGVVMEAELVELGSLKLTSPMRDYSLRPQTGGAVLHVLDQDELREFVVLRNGSIRLVRQTPSAGLRGIAATRDGLLAWGAAAAGIPPGISAFLDDVEVAKSQRGSVLTAGRNGVHIGDFETRTELSQLPARDALLVQDTMVVATADGLAVLVDEQDGWRTLTTVPFADMRALHRGGGVFANVPSVGVEFTDGGYCVVSLVTPAEPVVLFESDTRPWSARSARFDDKILIWQADSTEACLYRIARTETR